MVPSQLFMGTADLLHLDLANNELDALPPQLRRYLPSSFLSESSLMSSNFIQSCLILINKNKSWLFQLYYKRSTFITMFKNKIMKTLFDKYLVKFNRPNCFSFKQ